VPDILSDVVQRFREKSKAIEARPETLSQKLKASIFHGWAIKLFVWLVKHDECAKLEGFPALSQSSSRLNAAILTLSSDPKKLDEIPLAPIACWPERVRSIAFLIPRRHVLSDDYYLHLSDSESWGKLEKNGYVRLSPLFDTRQQGLPFIPDEPLPEAGKDRKVRHATKEAVRVSALAYFERDQAGLDVVRSKARAVELLDFLNTYVLELDPSSLEIATALCECGGMHRYYPSRWLVPMWERKWVPLGDDKRAPATAESIAQLFCEYEDEDTLRRLTIGKGAQLLEALDISVADLTLHTIAKDEPTRVKIINIMSKMVRAAGDDLNKLHLIAEEIKESPSFLSEIQDRRNRRENTRKNQQVGELVEQCLMEVLSCAGIKVTRTGVGSDFELIEDNLVDDRDVLMLIQGDRSSILVEVKATAGNLVRMTPKQAHTAVMESDRYILCVVPINDVDISFEAVRRRSRYIVDIGTRITPILNEYNRYQKTKKEVCTSVGDDIELYIEEGEARFAIGSGAWVDGLDINEAITVISDKLKGGTLAGF
jgi:hypothetical protein